MAKDNKNTTSLKLSKRVEVFWLLSPSVVLEFSAPGEDPVIARGPVKTQSWRVEVDTSVELSYWTCWTGRDQLSRSPWSWSGQTPGPAIPGCHSAGLRTQSRPPWPPRPPCGARCPPPHWHGHPGSPKRRQTLKTIFSVISYC